MALEGADLVCSEVDVEQSVAVGHHQQVFLFFVFSMVGKTSDIQVEPVGFC